MCTFCIYSVRVTKDYGRLGGQDAFFVLTAQKKAGVVYESRVSFSMAYSQRMVGRRVLVPITWLHFSGFVL